MSADPEDSAGRTRVWRRSAVGLGVLVLAAAAIGIDAATWDRDRVAAVGVCQDLNSGLRVPDQQCVTGQPGERWVYYNSGSTAPAVGGSTGAGSPVAPAGSGTVARGGEAEGGGEISEEGPSGSSGSSGSEGGEEGGSSSGGSGGGGSSGGSGGGGGGGGE